MRRGHSLLTHAVPCGNSVTTPSLRPGEVIIFAEFVDASLFLSNDQTALPIFHVPILFAGHESYEALIQVVPSANKDTITTA